jgi:hypothetical protein
MTKLFAQFLLVLAILILFCPQTGRTESSQLSEYEVKAAYLYNFAKFVEWPAASFPRDSTPLTICIVGKSPINEIIESLTGKTIKNRRLVIRQYSKIEDLGECQILFINAAAKTSLTQLLTATSSRAILTVSDSKGFVSSGGTIEFVPAGDKIRFEINNQTALRGNLKISSHLLRLATTVLE